MKSAGIPLATAVVVVAWGWGLLAERKPAAGEETPKPAFELRDGDRVVLLGGTMVEREQRYAGWEMLMTVLHPQQHITFRNLGWSGDTVWAESRGIFDPPAEGYKRMLAQVRDLKPTVIILGYGENESFAGEAGLENFLAQYRKLLSDLKSTKARFVFLGPPAHNAVAFPIPHLEQREADLKLYRDAIQNLAQEENAPFVDLYQSISEWMETTKKFADVPFEPISDNGRHWNARGYWYTALFLRRAFGWPLPHWNLTLSADGKAEPADGVTVKDLHTTKDGLEFTATSRALPLSKDYGDTLIVTGLQPGQYVLEIDGKKVAEGDSQNWADGVLIGAGAEFEQSAKLRETILRKNRLYFHRWRPQNVTYLFLFRKHEQGQNAKEVPQFDPLVAEAEESIQKLKKPRPHRYTLRRVSQ